MNRILVIFSALLVGSVASFGYTNVLDGSADQVVTNGWNLSGTNIWVGDVGSDNTLTIESGGFVTNATTYIGNSDTSMNNQITVSSNAYLTSSGSLYVGNEGSGNALVVMDGGIVLNDDAYVGYGSEATENTVMVSGSNSTWSSTGTLQIGNTGNSNNSVTVSDDGMVIAGTVTVEEGNDFNLNEDGTLAILNDFDAGQEGFNWNDNSTLQVNGALSGIHELDGFGKNLLLYGGSWNTGDRDLMVGATGATNFFGIYDGAEVVSVNGTIGGSGAISNVVVVSGTDSEWKLTGGQLDVTGEGNTLSVSSDGRVVIGDVDADSISAFGIIVASSDRAELNVRSNALVTTTHNLFIGSSESVTGTVTVADGGTITAAGLVIADANSAFNLNRDGTFTVLDDFNVRMDGFNWNEGGQLTIANGANLEGMTRLDGTDRVLALDGGYWDTEGDNLWVGETGGGNSLVVSNGGTAATSGDLYVGSTNASSVSNSVVIGDGGAVFANNLLVQGTENYINLNEGGLLGILGDFEVSSTNGLNWNGGGELAVFGSLSGLSGLEDDEQILQLYGDDAAWDLIGADLNIGTTGSLNRLIINAGAVVSNLNAVVGAGVGTNNSVLVSGVDSSWINSGTLTIGDESSGNSLEIYTGTVVNTSAWIGNLSTATSNSVQVSGSGAEWTNSGDLTVGKYGSENSLVIDGGGYVTNGAAFVGVAYGANSNTVVVTGSGSEWISSGTVSVGGGGNSSNRVTVTNFGSMDVAGLIVADGNEFNLDQDGSLTVSGTFDAGQSGFNWNNGSTLTVHSNLTGLVDMVGANKSLIVSGGLLDNAGDDLNIGGSYSSNSVTISEGGQVVVDNINLSYFAGGSENTLAVFGSNSTIVVADTLSVGRAGSENTLTIGADGLVSNQTAYVGYDGGSIGNTVVVSGDEAQWINGTLNVGNLTTNALGETVGNSGNSVSVSSNAWVQADTLNILDGNNFNLDEGGTLRMTGDFNKTDYTEDQFAWNSGGNLSVGGNFSGLTNVVDGRILTLDGNGIWDDAATNNMLVGGDGVLGATLNLTNGYVVAASNLYVNGVGTTVNVASNSWLLVGGDATTNALSGGMMVASSSTNGAALWVNEGASLTIDESLLIGISATSTGTVSVADGGSITAGTLVISDTNSAFNLESAGTLAITGAFDATMDGFNWNNGGALSVGEELTGMDNVLDGSSRELTLDGGSWNEGVGDLTIGESGSGNAFNVLNGGQASNANGYIGYHSNAVNNAVMVSGSNSVWNSTANLYVGYNGSNNTLVVSDGGRVVNTDGYVGIQSNAWNNAVVVSGSNSVWNNSNALTIGALGNSGNTVSVYDHGTVIATELLIYTNNQFNLGEGGTLSMTGDFNVSDYINESYTNLNWEAGGRLSVGGALSGIDNTELDDLENTYTYLNGGKTVIIDGVGASWMNGSDTNLVIGYYSSDSHLVVTNEGTVRNESGFIGWGSEAANNSVLVSGTGSEWRNREHLYLGGYLLDEEWQAAGTGNSLEVSDGGSVFVGDVAGGLTNGGLMVASAQGAEIIVGSGASVDAVEVYVGSGSATGTIDVYAGGSVTLTDLIISANTNNAFRLAGTLNVISNSNFNASMDYFEWMDDGSLVMENSTLTGVDRISGTNRTVEINGGSWSDFAGLFGSNGMLGVTSTSNTFSTITSTDVWIGSDSNSYHNAVTLSGSNTLWNNSGDLYVGTNSYGNSLAIQDGATTLTAGAAFVGTGSFASNNTVSVSGTNSLWQVGGDLNLGGSGSSNVLSVADSSLVTVGGNLLVQNESTLRLNSDGEINVAADMTISNSFVMGTGTILFNTNSVMDHVLRISGTNTVINSTIVFDAGNGSGVDKVSVFDWTFMVSTNTGNQYLGFEELELTDAVLSGSGSFNDFDFESVSVQGGILNPTGGALLMPEQFSVSDQPLLQVTANGDNMLKLTNADAFDLSQLDAEITIESGMTSLVDFNPIFITAENGLNGTFANTEWVEAYLMYDFNLVYTNSGEVSVEATAAIDGDISSALAFAGTESVRAGFIGMKNAVFTRTKQLRRNLVATAHSIPNEAAQMSNTNAPPGVQGPGEDNTIFDMHIWMQYYNGQGTFDPQGNSYGYTLNNNGTTFGADRLFGEDLIVGFNYTYARGDVQTTNGDSLDNETYWIGAYGEWVNENGVYVDAMAAYGSSSYDSVRVEDGYRGTASYGGNEFGGYVDVGQYFDYKNLSLSPYVGLHFLTLQIDSHSEEAVSGTVTQVDELSRSWFESALGLKARYRFDTGKGRFQTTGYAEWTHDFVQSDLDSSLSADGLSAVKTSLISPDADEIGVGLGFSWICTEYMEVGIGYNGRFSDHYEEHSGSLLLDVRF